MESSAHQEGFFNYRGANIAPRSDRRIMGSLVHALRFESFCGGSAFARMAGPKRERIAGANVTDQPASRDSIRSKEESASRALHEYRERRRIRRGEDTYFGSSALLRATVEEGLSETALDSRRESILQEAEEEGVPLELAELLYDVAWEEGIDPAVGFELVRTGLGVAPPDGGVSTASEVPATDKYLPAWMFPATPPDRLLRERMLRFSFRRLRSLLEKVDDVEEAFRLFANEPDVGHYGY